MNNECGARHKDESSIYTCNRYRGHPGSHTHTASDGEVYKAWPQAKPETCGDRYLKVVAWGTDTAYVCHRAKGHSGQHEGWNYGVVRYNFQSWPQTLPPQYQPAHPAGRGYGKTALFNEQMLGKFQEKENVVPLDAEELKILAYYLASVNEDDEDDVALKEKIDKALKAAL